MTETKRCCVVNCNKEVKEGEYKIIDGKIYCIECAVLMFTSMLLGLTPGNE
ncbi:MAG: hypothetical protein ACXQS8_03320 [Candidatus Helarchaeales archaeon]